MEKHYIDISKVNNYKDLYHAGWLFKDMKKDEIIILVSPSDYHANNPLTLHLLYILFVKGILYSDTANEGDIVDFTNKDLLIHDYNDLASELTKATGIKFSAQAKLDDTIEA